MRLTVNDAPAAAPNSYVTPLNTPLTVAAPGVLANDSDVENDPLIASHTGGPSNGSLTFNANGSFSYTPNAGFGGNDTFYYKPYDGQTEGNVVAVTITVNCPAASLIGRITFSSSALTFPF